MEGCDKLSKEQCKKIIEKYLNTKEKIDIKFYALNPLKSQFDGLMGDQFLVEIRYQIGDRKEETLQFFFKTVKGINSAMFEISKNIYAYEKEAFYYETFVPLLQSRGFDCSFAAKSYLCEDYFIVLEDLSTSSFRGTPKNKPLNLPHCKKCLETLAKFHVGPIMYEITKGKDYSLKDDFEGILEDKVFSEEENYASKFIRCSVEGLFLLLDLIPENGVAKNDFKAKLGQVLNNITATREDSMGFRCTTLHGDLWANNFLYKYDDGEISDCKLIDFQMLKYGPPASDVLQFIYTNTRKNFRDEHKSELLAYYYSYISNLLAERGLPIANILNESEYKKSCDAVVLPTKIFSIVDRSITCIPEETYAAAYQSEEKFKKFLYEERGRYITDAYNEDEYFRELMIEEITELRDMLFAQ